MSLYMGPLVTGFHFKKTNYSAWSQKKKRPAFYSQHHVDDIKQFFGLPREDRDWKISSIYTVINTFMPPNMETKRTRIVIHFIFCECRKKIDYSTVNCIFLIFTNIILYGIFINKSAWMAFANIFFFFIEIYFYMFLYFLKKERLHIIILLFRSILTPTSFSWANGCWSQQSVCAGFPFNKKHYLNIKNFKKIGSTNVGSSLYSIFKYLSQYLEWKNFIPVYFIKYIKNFKVHSHD